MGTRHFQEPGRKGGGGTWVDEEMQLRETNNVNGGIHSMATPHVSGVAALFAAIHPQLHTQALRALILASGTRGRLKDLSPRTVNLLAYNWPEKLHRLGMDEHLDAKGG